MFGPPFSPSEALGVAHIETTNSFNGLAFLSAVSWLHRPDRPSLADGVGHIFAACGKLGLPPLWNFGDLIPSKACGVGHILTLSSR
jgi:hypothetical protein